MMKRFVLVLMCLPVFGGLTQAGGYSEFYVKSAKSTEVDAAIKSLRKTAFEAARNADLNKLQATFAESVTIYSATADPDSMDKDKFKLVREITRENVVANIAGQVVSPDKVSKKQLMRSGFFAVAALLRDPAVGANGKMNGAICNRPVNKPNAKEFASARTATKSRMVDWVVVKHDMGPSSTANTPGQYPTKFFQDQMVLRTKESHNDKRWTSIAALDGGESLYYQNPQSFSIAPYFADYVAQHVCFGKQNGEWKITSFAIRVE